MEEPFFSVVIATRGRAHQLEHCLDSLEEQEFPRARWEVIVVHDGEAAPPERECGHAIALRRLQTHHVGCGLARNAGAAQARGRYLIFTDDDCTFPLDWLSRFEDGFRANPQCLIAGGAHNSLSNNLYAQATQAMTELLLRFSNRSDSENNVAVGNNMGVPAADFAALGGFSPRHFRNAAEDREFSARWLAAGKRIVFQPGLVVHHAHQMNLRGFLRQHYNYGRGAYVLHRTLSERHQRRWQPASFYAAMLLHAPSPRVSMLLALSQIAHTAGFARGFFDARKSRASAAQQALAESKSNQQL